MTLEKNDIPLNGKGHKQTPFKDLGIFQRSLIGQKLLCRVWSDTGENSTPVRLAKKTIKYGAPNFSVKVAGKDRFFKINYEEKGLIKQDGKQLVYDTHFNNTVGGLSFHEFPEAMDSDQAYTVFRNNAVDMYVKKGGIPFLWLVLALGVAMVAMIVMVLTVPSALQAGEQMKELDEQVTALKNTNQALQDENNSLRSQLRQNQNG